MYLFVTYSELTYQPTIHQLVYITQISTHSDWVNRWFCSWLIWATQLRKFFLVSYILVLSENNLSYCTPSTTSFPMGYHGIPFIADINLVNHHSGNSRRFTHLKRKKHHCSDLPNQVTNVTIHYGFFLSSLFLLVESPKVTSHYI